MLTVCALAQSIMIALIDLIKFVLIIFALIKTKINHSVARIPNVVVVKFVELENDDTKILPIPDTARILRERGVYKLPPDEIAIMSREFIAEGFLGLFKILIYHHMNKVADPVIDYAEHAERARRKARNRLAGIVLADILINQIPLIATGMLLYFGYKAVDTRRRMDRAIASIQHYPINPPDLREHIDVTVSSSRSG